MRELRCGVRDSDIFSSELIAAFIERTQGVSFQEHTNLRNFDKLDVLFVDADLSEDGISSLIDSGPELVIISSNSKYIHRLFKNQIADYLFKPELSYDRFLESISLLRKRISNSANKSI